jgi:hypothetical protein
VVDIESLDNLDNMIQFGLIHKAYLSFGSML